MRAWVLLAALASPASAMTAQQCADSFEAAANLIAPDFTFTLPAVAIDGSCEARGILAELNERLTLEIDSLRWTMEDPDRFIRDVLPPTAISLSIEGMRYFSRIDDPVMDYASRLRSQSVAMSAGLEMEWDADAKVLTLGEARWSDGFGNAVTVSAQVDGVDLTSWDSIAQSAGSAGLSEARIVLESAHFVEAYLAIPLAGLLLERDRLPGEQVVALRAVATQMVDLMPESILPSASAEDLRAVIADMPQLRGTLTVDVSSDPPWGSGRFLRFAVSGLPQTADEVWSVLDGVTFDIDWQPR